MGQITSLFVRKVLSEADASVDREALLSAVGIDPASLDDPSTMVPDNEYYAFLERLAVLDANGTTIPLRAGAAMCCDDYGAFGLAWKSAINLRGSYDRAQRYARVLTNVSTYEVEATEDGAFVNLHRVGERRLGMRLSDEASIASLASISRQVSTEVFNPIGVYFRHAAPKSTVDHENYFGCPVAFESNRDALLVSNETLQTPNRLAMKAFPVFSTRILKLKFRNLQTTARLSSWFGFKSPSP
jgi:hypothetical protein